MHSYLDPAFGNSGIMLFYIRHVNGLESEEEQDHFCEIYKGLTKDNQDTLVCFPTLCLHCIHCILLLLAPPSSYVLFASLLV